MGKTLVGGITLFLFILAVGFAHVRGLEIEKLEQRVMHLEGKLIECDAALVLQKESYDVKTQTLQEQCENLARYYDTLPPHPNGVRKENSKEGPTTEDHVSPHHGENNGSRKPSRWHWW